MLKLNSMIELPKKAGLYVHVAKFSANAAYFKKQVSQQMKLPQQTLRLIDENLSGIPYLSIIQNLQITQNKESYSNERFYKGITLLEISEFTLKKTLFELSLFENIKLQLLYSFLHKKQQIILHDLFDNLTIAEIQQLLSMLHHLVTAENMTILCYTSDKDLANSPYIDAKI
ncbi:ABC-type multidrug transport system ATPase subunit [Enterococcus sp. PF1-24]|uniref:hypothetical protein n=1 Tax=unclassified Enterococcus TaxID=2608891 RepID=UPI002474B797|nr:MULTISPECIES: hypothetical protein [unclassified Enterococcus]MDH6365597.1 ABC-type multidrug transport system ATPase subunit [Enterococcus sp. PFB1-1]MDH6402687.1 ABC-type multidrug transport system ATPase subunit [Enterococcus sp. PF1-24]